MPAPSLWGDLLPGLPAWTATPQLPTLSKPYAREGKAKGDGITSLSLLRPGELDARTTPPGLDPWSPPILDMRLLMPTHSQAL